MSESFQRRRHRRVTKSLPVRIATIDPERDLSSGRAFFRALEETSANVSRGGAFVRTREPLDRGRRVLLELDLPDGTRLETIGRVAWTKHLVSPSGVSSNPGVGIEFLGGASDHFFALDDFLTDAEDDESDG